MTTTPEEYKFITSLLERGYLTIQVPDLEVSVLKGKAVLLESKSSMSASLLTRGVLCWKTNKGFVSGLLPKNPKTGRRLPSAFLCMSKEFVTARMDDLFATYSAGRLKRIQADRELFEEMLLREYRTEKEKHEDTKYNSP